MKDYSNFNAISIKSREIVMSRYLDGKGDIIASIMAVFGNRLQKRLFADRETEKQNFLKKSKINLDGLSNAQFDDIFNGCYEWYSKKHKNQIASNTNYQTFRKLFTFITQSCHIYDCERIAFYAMECFIVKHKDEPYDVQGYNILGYDFIKSEMVAHFLFYTMGKRENLKIIETLSKLEQSREL